MENMGNVRTREEHSAANTRLLTGVSILAAVVVVLTVLCNFVRFGPFSITLALAPIVIGSAIYGRKAGAILGLTFGVVVMLTGIAGMDGGSVLYLISQNPIAVFVIVFAKGAAAGWAAGAVYHLVEKKSRLLAVTAAAVVSPVVNTGLFLAGMMVFYFDTLAEWSRSNTVLAIILAMTGVNFVIEIIVNVFLSSTIDRIISVAKKS